MSLFSLLESSCNTYKPTIGRDSHKGLTQDPFVLVSSQLPCSAQQASASVQTMYAQRDIHVNATLYFDADPQVQANWYAKVTDPDGNITYYLIQGQAQPVARGVQWQVDALAIMEPVGINSPTVN